MLKPKPITLREAAAFVKEHHRHHPPPRGNKFSIGATNNEELVGVVIVGRPLSRMLDDGKTAEVLRLCTTGEKNACSFLYAAAWRAARAMGYTRLITYILENERGTSLCAAGWRELYTTKAESWSRNGRPREDRSPIARKRLFEA